MTFDGKRRTNRDYGDSPVRRSRVPIASSRLASSTRGTASRLPFGSAVESWPPQPSACPRPSPHAVPRVGDASRAAASVGIARRRAEKERAEAFSRLRATTTPADPRCSRRRSAGGDDGTTLFRSVISDEDGGNPANIAASGASNQNTARCASSQEAQLCGCQVMPLM